MSTTYQTHPYAEIFPDMEKDDFRELCESIKSRGLDEPIVLYEGKVLDGRQRLRACLKVGEPPRFKEYDGDDPLGYVWARNFARRNLTTGQKAVAALKYKDAVAADSKRRQKLGGKIAAPGLGPNLGSAPAAESGKTATILADKLGVGRGTMESAIAVEKKAPELLPYVSDGTLAVSTAAEMATSGSLMAAVRDGNITVHEAAKVVREARADRDAKREAKKNRKKARLRPPSSESSLYTYNRVVVHVRAGRAYAGMWPLLVKQAWSIAKAAVLDGDSIRLFVDGVECPDPLSPPPPPEGWSPVGETIAGAMATPFNVTEEANKYEIYRRRAEALEDDLAAELAEALGGGIERGAAEMRKPRRVSRR